MTQRESLETYRIGDYQILSVLGRGGMGVVYKARHLAHGHVVALKVLASHLSQDPTFVRRFEDEYTTLHTLYHHNIVRVYEFGQDSGRYFIAVEYIEGPSLEKKLAGKTPLRATEVIRIIRQVAQALDAVHPRGIVHRDLKPSNILLERGGRVVLTDFGIASIADWQRKQKQERAQWGTPEYMAPEQARGDPIITHHADIYALGVVTYRMLCGRVPFQREVPLAVLHAHVHQTPLPLRSTPRGKRLPPQVDRVVLQALAKDPRSRQARAGDFAQQLEKAMNPLLQSSQLQPLMGIAVGTFTVLFVALVFFLVRQKGSVPGSLAYVCQIEEEMHICVTDEMGRGRIYTTVSRDWSPSWSYDGARIAFASDREGSTDIWILEPDSGTVYSLVEDTTSDESSPSWSPGGEGIAFDRRGRDGDYDVCVYWFEQSQIELLTSSTAHDSDPSWAPDGQHITFVSERSGNMEIYTLDIRAGHSSRLTRDAGKDFAPVWSPDGEWIAYECEDQAEGDIEICIVEPDGGSRQVLTDNEVDDRQPAWSPDGQHIAFCRPERDESRWSIWVMGADGRNQRVWIRDRYSNTHPVWRP